MRNLAIEIKHVYFAYEHAPILQDFSLDIKKGAFVCLTGESGSGKSTLLKLLNGLLVPLSGEIYIEGEKLTPQNLLHVRRNMGYILQDSSLFPHLTVAQNMAYCLNLQKASPAHIKERINHLLPLVNLDPALLPKFPTELSGGQRQRVGIIRGIAHEPKIILMDEPFSALDPVTRADLQDLVKKIHKVTNTTFVMVTHSLSEAEKLGTAIVNLDTIA